MDLPEQIGLIAGLLGALLLELLGKNMLIRAWALNRDNTVPTVHLYPENIICQNWSMSSLSLTEF